MGLVYHCEEIGVLTECGRPIIESGAEELHDLTSVSRGPL